MPATLDELSALDAYVRAANYLTVGQIYLQDNPLLREPLRAEHVKARLLGHWGTSPGQSLIYAHVNRAIRLRDLDAIYLSGPGHGGPAIVANAYLEGTYSERCPGISQDAAGLRALFRQFSTPGGIPSHAGPHVPGSIHEGGELGYVLTHAFGAVFDAPSLVAIAVVGDGEAETAPLEGSWKGISFVDPRRDGAVLPVLHLNGYKIAGPTVLGRSSDADIAKLLEGHGYAPYFVVGDDPMTVHRAFAQTLDRCLDEIAAIQGEARATGRVMARPRWPLIVLRTPKGWTGPREVDGVKIEGTFRSHQVPLGQVRSNPAHLAMLEAWLRSYRPEELFDANGRLVAQLAALAPQGDRRMSANPWTTGRRCTPLVMPELTSYAITVANPGLERHESTRPLGSLLRDVYIANPTSFRLFCPDETASNRLAAVFEATDRCLVSAAIEGDEHVGTGGRVMEVLSEHNCEGWLEGYVLTGRHGMFATYEAFAMVAASMVVQHAKWLEATSEIPWRLPVPSLNVLLTSTCWRNDHNGFSHQGPGLIDVLLSARGTVSRIYLPPDANCLLSIANHCLRSHDYINAIVIDKQPELQWLSLAAADEHCARGLSVWGWAGSNDDGDPDIVLACAGDTATLETLAAAAWLREHAPEQRLRVVNVVDLMRLAPVSAHPHGLDDATFADVFTAERDVVFAFHGHAGVVHQLLHGRSHPSRFHVRGYREEGSTTTPFDMVVRNETSRYHLVIEALRRSRRISPQASELTALCRDKLAEHAAYVRATFEDLPEIEAWRWRQ